MKPTFKTRLPLLILLLLTLVPLLLGLLYALAYSLGWWGLLSQGHTWAHWQAVMQDGDFWRALGFSAYIALGSVLLCLLFALLVVALGREVFRGPWRFLLYLPLVFPPLVVAFVFFQSWSQGGWFSRLLYQWGWIKGLQDFPILVNDAWGLGILLSHLALVGPFFSLLLLNIYDNEQLNRLRGQAAQLGANRWQQWRRIVWPLLWRRSAATLLLYGVFFFGAYEIPLLLGRQSPQMLSVFSLEKLQKFDIQQKPQAYVATLFYALLLLSFLIAFFRFVRSANSGPNHPKHE